MDTTSAPPPPGILDVIDRVTILSLGFVVVLLFLAYALSVFLLPPRTTTAKTRVIFVWHLFDCLIHVIFEGSFLYYSFFASKPTSLQGPSHHVLWGDSATVYGTAYSDSPLAVLWQEYAKADFRWGQSDICVVTLEIITVFVGGPLALWICDMIRKEDDRRWFWIVVLATGELYGGYMTFMPEWITGSHNLETSNFMYKWIYLFFFNTLWVWIPLWLLYEAYNTFLPALKLQSMIGKTANTLSGATFDDDESSEEVDESDVDEGEGVSVSEVLEGKKVR